MLLGPLRLLFDVLGDVVFFVVPTSSPLSILRETTGRLRTILSKFQDDDVTVMAYSQGCVIALQALTRDYRGALITVGCPIQSLYQRFLGFDFAIGRRDRTWPWLNLWRRGDYISGPVKDADGTSEPLSRDGGHLNYLSDPEVWNVLLSHSASPTVDET